MPEPAWLLGLTELISIFNLNLNPVRQPFQPHFWDTKTIQQFKLLLNFPFQLCSKVLDLESIRPAPGSGAQRGAPFPNIPHVSFIFIVVFAPMFDCPCSPLRCSIARAKMHLQNEKRPSNHTAFKGANNIAFVE